MEKEKIALFIPTLEVGGAEKVTLNIANEISNRGYSVDLVLVKAKGEYMENVGGNVRVVDLNSKSAMMSIKQLVKYLKENKPIAMISAIENCNVAALIAKKFACVETKIVVTIHTTLSRILKDVDDIKVKLNMILQKKLYKNAYNIIAVSKATADDASKVLNIPRDRINVIYNPIINEYLLNNSKMEVESKFFNNGNYINILSVGRLTDAKSFDTLIKAFNIVLCEMKNVRLTIIGEGNKRQELKELSKNLKIEQYIDMPGFKTNPYAYMSKCDVFVLSSKWEGLPSVIIEAMACGAKIVSTDCKSGPREILEDGKYGKLCPVGDEKKLAEMIIESLNDKTNIVDIDTHLKKFSFDKIIDEYINSIN